MRRSALCCFLLTGNLKIRAKSCHKAVCRQKYVVNRSFAAVAAYWHVQPGFGARASGAGEAGCQGAQQGGAWIAIWAFLIAIAGRASYLSRGGSTRRQTLIGE
jgi:hypothetical protein